MSGLRRLRVDALASVPVMGARVFVQEAEGDVQVIWASEGWPGHDGPRPFFNDFPDAQTPAQLRALAQVVEAALARKGAA